jgi:hypothetical protein
LIGIADLRVDAVAAREPVAEQVERFRRKRFCVQALELITWSTAGQSAWVSA